MLETLFLSYFHSNNFHSDPWRHCWQKHLSLCAFHSVCVLLFFNPIFFFAPRCLGAKRSRPSRCTVSISCEKRKTFISFQRKRRLKEIERNRAKKLRKGRSKYFSKDFEWRKRNLKNWKRQNERNGVKRAKVKNGQDKTNRVKDGVREVYRVKGAVKERVKKVIGTERNKLNKTEERWRKNVCCSRLGSVLPVLFSPLSFFFFVLLSPFVVFLLSVLFSSLWSFLELFSAFAAFLCCYRLCCDLCCLLLRLFGPSYYCTPSYGWKHPHRNPKRMEQEKAKHLVTTWWKRHWNGSIALPWFSCQPPFRSHGFPFLPSCLSFVLVSVCSLFFALSSLPSWFGLSLFVQTRAIATLWGTDQKTPILDPPIFAHFALRPL